MLRPRPVVPTRLATAIAVAYGWSELTTYLWTDHVTYRTPYAISRSASTATSATSAPAAA
ncbi:MAG: hypothetical protein V7607_3470 [Solirubrobacteraceae bacterium]